MNRGIHHVGLATHDMESTLDFYENVLGFPAVVCEMIEPETGGAIRHAFFDVGQGELIAFMEANDIPGIASDFDTGINRGLGTGDGMYHFAFKVSDPIELEKKRQELISKDLAVRGIVDHGWCQFESALDFLCRGHFHSSRAPDINDRSSTPNVRLDIPAVIFQTIFERRG